MRTQIYTYIASHLIAYVHTHGYIYRQPHTCADVHMHTCAYLGRGGQGLESSLEVGRAIICSLCAQPQRRERIETYHIMTGSSLAVVSWILPVLSEQGPTPHGVFDLESIANWIDE